MEKLTRVGVDYADRLAALWAETFHQAYGSLHTEENIRAYCATNFTPGSAEAALADPGVVCKVAFSGSTALGYYLTRADECPLLLDGRSAELKQIYVLRSEYGSGLGTRLFDDSVQSIRDSGASWVWLMVSDLNYRAGRFYRKREFERLGVGPVIEIGTDRLPSTIMGRKI